VTHSSSVALAIVGPTAVGKSDVSLAVARMLEPHGGAEVINADSMQFYRGMDIGTAKLSLAERQGIAHHHIDTLDVHEDASAARYQADGRRDLQRISESGAVPLVVGGSGLYLRALLDVFEFPGTDPEVRSALERRAEDEGPGILHRELAELDPVAADKISPRNAKRIVRALEIIHLAGAYESSLPRHEYAVEAVQVGLDIPTPNLDERISARVDRMWNKGLVDEVRGLESRGLREGVTARRAVGYAETLAYLDGENDAPQTRELIARNTRRLARRQRRWFAPDPRITWLEGPRDAGDVEPVARAVVEAYLAARVT
jgi:tRNA dimethylallyltransferase